MACIDGKLAESPDEQGRNNNPLREAQQRRDPPPQRGTPRRRQGLDGRVDKVVCEEGEAVGQAAVSAADIKGDWYGEDDGEQEDDAEEAAEEPQHDSLVSRIAVGGMDAARAAAVYFADRRDWLSRVRYRVFSMEGGRPETRSFRRSMEGAVMLR